ncbi:hypothetical protein Tco_1102511 [Tanacetum coccineum]
MVMMVHDLDYLSDSLGILCPSSSNGPSIMERNADYAEELATLQRQEYEAKDAAARYGPAGIVSADGVSTGSPSADSDPAGSNPVEPTDESNPALQDPSFSLNLTLSTLMSLHFLFGQQLAREAELKKSKFVKCAFIGYIQESTKDQSTDQLHCLQEDMTTDHQSAKYGKLVQTLSLLANNAIGNKMDFEEQAGCQRNSFSACSRHQVLLTDVSSHPECSQENLQWDRKSTTGRMSILAEGGIHGSAKSRLLWLLLPLRPNITDKGIMIDQDMRICGPILRMVNPIFRALRGVYSSCWDEMVSTGCVNGTASSFIFLRTSLVLLVVLWFLLKLSFQQDDCFLLVYYGSDVSYLILLRRLVSCWLYNVSALCCVPAVYMVFAVAEPLSAATKSLGFC